MKVTFDRCARCGGKHVDLEFTKMLGEPVETIDGIYRYWAMCPGAMQPIILMRGEDNCVHPELEAEKKHNEILEKSNKEALAKVEELKKELEEYGPDYVDELQQKIDEQNVRISDLEGEMSESNECTCLVIRKTPEKGCDLHGMTSEESWVMISPGIGMLVRDAEDVKRWLQAQDSEINSEKYKNAIKVMTNFHDDHVYEMKGTEGYSSQGWLRPCCRVDESGPHKGNCEVGKIIGNNPPRMHQVEEDEPPQG